MRHKLIFMLFLITAALYAFNNLTIEEAVAQVSQTSSQKEVTLTGKIAKVRHLYIIRSVRDNAPSEIFTIRNPKPEILNEFVKTESVVLIDARIISGDNLIIQRIDGTVYDQPMQ